MSRVLFFKVLFCFEKKFQCFGVHFGFSFLIASVFSLIGLIASCEFVCPKHTVSFWWNFDFFSLALYPSFSSFGRTDSSFLVCCSFVLRVTTNMSSIHTGENCRSVRFFSSWKIVGISAGP